MDEKEIVYNDFVDINVAVASERGCVYYGCYLPSTDMTILHVSPILC